MKRGGKVLCGVAVLAVAACTGNQGTLEIRPTKTVLAAGERPVSFRVAEARGQLALGNVALALESFRKALREDPASVDALAGIATCYDRMGRYDLSRRNYEAALALAPADTQLLAALAGSLDLQGRAAEAASVRSEIAQRLAAAAATAEPNPAPQLVSARPVPGSDIRSEPVGIQQADELPPVPPARQVASVAATPVVAQSTLAAPAAPARNAVQAPVSAPVPVTVAVAADSAELRVAPLKLDLPVVVAEAPVVEKGASVTIKLPPPRPVPVAIAQVEPGELPGAPATTAMVDMREIASAPAMRLPAIRSRAVRDAKVERSGPRLERLSMGEVALVTASGPRWRAEPVSRSARSTTVRFVPVRQSTDFAEVRLLNAARVHRLAARTRAWMAGRGWQGVSIGDAPSTRARSIILYPAGQRSVARKLSAQFGFAMAPRRDLQQVTVLLGRDSLRIAGARAKA